MKLLIALGEGGHTKEMVTLIDSLGDGYEYAYLVVQDDEVSESKIRLPGKLYRVIRPRDKKHNTINDILKTLKCGLQSLRVMMSFRPDAVLSAGPSIAVPVCLVAKLMRRKVVFVETGSRITELSTTGRIVYRFADLFFVQWPGLVKRYPKSVFAGRLF